MENNLENPYYEALFETIKSVYDKHDDHKPLNQVNVSEFVDAVMPVVGKIANEEVANAIHPEFGWYWRETESSPNDGQEN